MLAANADIKSQLSPRRDRDLHRRLPADPAQLVPLIQPKATYSGTPFRIVVPQGQIVSMLGLSIPDQAPPAALGGREHPTHLLGPSPHA